MFGWLFLNRAFLFAWAAVTGFLFALVWKQYEQTVHRTLTHYRITPSGFDYQWAYDSWLTGLGLTSTALLRTSSPPPPQNNVNRTDPSIGRRPAVTTEDRWLTSKVPVFCVVLSRKQKQTRAVKQTWAKHCNGVAFYGSFTDRSIPVKKVADDGRGTGGGGGGDGYNVQCEALRETWRDRRGDFRWVLVATDRTYAVVENLRYMVAGLDSSEAHYLGHAFRDYDGDFNVEDAGYVLSWGALQAFSGRFDAAAPADQDECGRHEFWSSGDRTVGKALQELGVRPRDTRDTLERSRFLPFSLDKLLIPGSISLFNRYWRESVFLSPEGSGCCSDFAVTFSDVSPDKMHMMEYIIYHLKPVSHRWPPLPPDTGPTSPPPITTVTTKRVAPTLGKAFVSELTAGAAVKHDSPAVGAAGKLFPLGSSSSVDVANEIDENEVSGDTDKEPSMPDDAVTTRGEVANGHGEPRRGPNVDADSAVTKPNYDVVREDEYFDDVGEGDEESEGKLKDVGAKT